ncbi:4-phosphoerythronate dehydrogenase [bacterium]|nr:4-phosphoerythronate dehydrogenase [bacterium]
MTRILCSRGVSLAEKIFSDIGELEFYTGGTLKREMVESSDVLVTRSIDRIDKNILDGSMVRFVGSATTGNDHFDLEYMNQMKIHSYNAAGCNSNSVAEYVIAALFELSIKNNFQLSGKTLGIIGVGNIGSNLSSKAESIGLKILLNDPPRKRICSEENEFIELEKLVESSDIISLHVPLTRRGEDKTFHLGNREFFEKMKPGCTFINCSRGAVVNTDDLLWAMNSGKIRYSVIDTWENEPEINIELLEKVDIGTPHIAGHSIEAKILGTVMVYQDLCKLLNIKPVWNRRNILETLGSKTGELKFTGKKEKSIYDIINQVYQISKDYEALKKSSSSTIGENFSYLRRNYSVRLEFKSLNLKIENSNQKFNEIIQKLGFSIR